MDRDVLVTKLALLKTLRKSASRRLALAAGEPKCRKPITGPCCALMGSGNATAALPTSVMNSRRRKGHSIGEIKYSLGDGPQGQPAVLTLKSCHCSWMPLSECSPASSNSMPEPATRSFTVLEMVNSPGPAVSMIRAAR